MMPNRNPAVAALFAAGSRTLHGVRFLVPVVGAFALLGLPEAEAAPGDERWSERFYVPGTEGVIEKAVMQGNYLYVAGNFSRMGNAAANKVARFNYTTSLWESLGLGVNNTPSDMVALGSDVYISGITGATNISGPITVAGIARWDGANFFSVQGPAAAVGSASQMAVSGGTLYARGFSSPRGIFRMDVNGWTQLGVGRQAGAFDYVVQEGPLSADSGSLWCWGPGVVNPASTNPVFLRRTLWRWAGSAWVTESGEAPSFAYTGERFLMAGGNAYIAPRQLGAPDLLTWTGSQWASPSPTTFEGGYDGFPSYLAKHNGNLIALGSFTTINGSSGVQTVNHAAMWNASSWATFGQGFTGPMVGTVSEGNNILFFGGPRNLTWGYGGYDAGPKYAINLDGTEVYTGGIVRWTGSRWEAFGGGLGADNPVEVMTVVSNEIYLGGRSISWVGGARVAGLAKANTAAGAASPLGEFRWDGGNGYTFAACTYNGQPVMAGRFGTATNNGTNITLNSIARWTGSSWEPLGSGLSGAFAGSGEVRALVAKDGFLYVGGLFSGATDAQGTKAVNNVARWDGTNWSALGNGIPGLGFSYHGAGVLSLRFVGTNLFAVTTSPAGVWRWTGATWSNIATMANSSRPRLGTYRGSLILGGVPSVTNSAGVGFQINGIARLDGSNWVQLGGGLGPVQISPWVGAIEEVDGRLYVGGSFGNSTNVNSPPAGFGVWDGSNWSTVGSGLVAASGWPPPQVYALQAYGGQMFVGGDFSAAGGKFAGNWSSFALLPAGTQTYADWAAGEGLSGGGAQAGARPWNDGLPNLLKYAFNLKGSGPDNRVLEEGTGLSGLPAMRRAGNVLRMEFLRRTGVGLTYQPVKRGSMAGGTWTNFADTPTVESLGDGWERVVYEEPITPGTPSMFTTVQVVQN